MSDLQFAQTVQAEHQQYMAYIDWILDKHPDCDLIRSHGADDGSLLAWETGYLWDEFVEWSMK